MDHFRGDDQNKMIVGIGHFREAKREREHVMASGKVERVRPK
jgi:hypothetical protein